MDLEGVSRNELLEAAAEFAESGLVRANPLSGEPGACTRPLTPNFHLAESSQPGRPSPRASEVPAPKRERPGPGQVTEQGSTVIQPTANRPSEPRAAQSQVSIEHTMQHQWPLQKSTLTESSEDLVTKVAQLLLRHEDFWSGMRASQRAG